MTGRIAKCWEAAVVVTAAAYGVDPALVARQSRGRGPRPPPEIWEPRKLAVHLAIVLSDATYAELGRHIGLHRDTVASHCDWAREACAQDVELEGRVDALTTMGLSRVAFGFSSDKTRPSSYKPADHGNVIPLRRARA